MRMHGLIMGCTVAVLLTAVQLSHAESQRNGSVPVIVVGRESAPQAANSGEEIFPGSKIRLYKPAFTTQSGHVFHGTSEGLACLKRAPSRDDPESEGWEFTCPGVMFGCYIKPDRGSSHGVCGGHSYPASAHYNPGISGVRDFRITTRTQVSLFFFAPNQCEWNASLIRAMPDGWAAGCNMSTAELQKELGSNNGSKLDNLFKKKWGRS